MLNELLPKKLISIDIKESDIDYLIENNKNVKLAFSRIKVKGM